MRRLQQIHRRERSPQGGQALVEFALILPVLALVFAAIIQFALIYETQMGLTNASREAARRAAAFQTDESNRDVNGAWIVDQLELLLPQHVQGYDPDLAELQVCYASASDPAGTSQLHAEVAVAYGHALFLPIVDGFFDGVDGVIDDRVKVTATTAIRVRNSPGIDGACYS